MTNLVVGWFQLTHKYIDNIVMRITNLVIA